MLPALVIAGLVGAGTLIGSPAHAATAPVIIDARNTGTPGVVSVQASAEAGIASVVAHIMDTSVDPAVEVATVSDFYLAVGSATDGFWYAAEAAQVPLGNYRVDVEVTDGDGVHAQRQAAGWLWVYADLSFTDVKVAGKVNYANREITVSGRVLGAWPGGLVRPVADQPVGVRSDNGTVETVTNRDGRFRATITIVSNQDYVDVSTFGVPFHSQAYQSLGIIPVTQAPTRITVSVDRKKILRYESVTITGQATWKSPDGWQTVQIIDVANNPRNPGGIFFEQSVISDKAGYWRVHYAGAADTEKATSPAVSVAAGTPAA